MNATAAERLGVMFAAVLRVSESIRKADSRADGLAFWRGLKAAIVQALGPDNASVAEEQPLGEWSAVPDDVVIDRVRTRYADVERRKPTESAMGTEAVRKYELSHFAMQLVRIPELESPTLFKILQLALNAGQFKGTQRLTGDFDICVARIIDRSIVMRSLPVDLSEADAEGCVTPEVCDAALEYLVQQQRAA